MLGSSMGAAGGSVPHSKVLSKVFLADVGIWTRPQQKMVRGGKRSADACGRGESAPRAGVMDGRGERQRVEGISWMISVNTYSPLISGLTSSDSDDPCCHGDWQNKCDTSLLPLPPICEWWKWMWPRDQHAVILAQNQYFFPLSCIGPVSCNISIHTCAQSTLILPVCVCVCVCVCEGREKCCIEQKLPGLFELLH